MKVQTVSAPLTLALSAVAARPVVPRGLGAQFVGLRLHHAFVSFDSQLSGIDFASNPLRLSLIK